MKKLIVTALLAGAAMAHAQTASAPAPAAPSSPAKKELIQRLLVLQQPGIEGLARNLVEQPAAAMMQAAGRALQQVPAEKREAIGKSIEADVKKYVDESNPVVRDRAVKLAPSTIGAAMDEKFSEDELKQLVAWLESPVNKKYAQLGADIQKNFTEKLVAESRPTVEPKLQALETKVRASLGVPA
ncbi:MAG TPA: hypothetical protein VNU71_19495, partial [Burkholderiaceae bacterium]|nr:hypothetical protein [Burkholderiaceae bacterium]